MSAGTEKGKLRETPFSDPGEIRRGLPCETGEEERGKGSRTSVFELRSASKKEGKRSYYFEKNPSAAGLEG